MKNKANSNDKYYVSDIYYIFADNIYQQFLTYDKFKALLNFYALLYDRIIVPDSFFINNKYLIDFIETDKGKEYIDNGIIVPSIRNQTTNLLDTYNEFIGNSTLLDNGYSDSRMRNYLESINTEHAIKWDMEDIKSNFENNLLNRIDFITIDSQDKGMWLDGIYNLTAKKTISRKLIRDMTNTTKFNNVETSSILNSFVDVAYNFNIPNCLGTSVAYPEQLMNNKMFKISPQDVFFSDEISKKDQNIILDENYMDTAFFNMGILSNLSIEQIKHLRKLKQYKAFVACLKNDKKSNRDLKIGNSFIDYIYEFNSELPRIINNASKKELEKNRNKLKICNLGKDTVSGDITGIVVEEILDGLLSVVGAKLIGSLLKIVTKPLTSNIERNVKKIEIDGNNSIEKIKSKESIADTLKSFSLNSLSDSRS